MTASDLHFTQDKSLFIEQCRGIAVLLVVAYHYTNIIPYAVLGADSPPLLSFYTGQVGVYIFFIISGYLIAKTIQKSHSVGEFYAKRASRIWPLFLLANIVIFTWMQFFPVPLVDGGPKDFNVSGRTIGDLIGSSLFLMDLGFKSIDTAFWSILVELKFYFWVGIVAVLFKNRFVSVFAWIAATLSVLDFAVLVWVGHGENTLMNTVLHGVFIAQYLPYFAIGMLLLAREINLVFVVCCLMAVAQILVSSIDNPDFNVMGTVEFLSVFSLFLMADKFLFRGQVTRFVGEYSYSLYLFHQVIGLSCLLMLIPYVGYNMAIVLIVIFVMALAVAASKVIEWRYRRKVTAFLFKLFGFVGLNSRVTRLHLDVSQDPETKPKQSIPAKGV